MTSIALPTSMVKPTLESMYKDRRIMVPLFIGAPGIGKTQGVYQFAEEKGVNVVTFILSNTVPSEISGIRMPDQETKKLEVFDDSRMASLKDGDILFFDEILTAPPMLWDACLTLIKDRIMASGRKLPDVFIVAASNPIASPSIIAPSTRDRFKPILLRFDKDHWCQWFKKKHGVSPEKLVNRIQEDSDQYSILSPRCVEELYIWLKNTDMTNDDEIETKELIVNSMFDSQVFRYLWQMVNNKPSYQVQIARAINENTNAHVDEETFEHLSLKEIMRVLEGLPEWDEIQEVLKNQIVDNDE